MNISISGQHIHVEPKLQDYIKSKLPIVIHKYLSNVLSADIHFSKQHIDFYCNIVVNHANKKHGTLKSNEYSNDIFISFDRALRKLEQQLRKYKSKLKEHNGTKLSQSMPIIEATKYTINPYQDDDDNNQDIDNPVIIAEKPVEILCLSVGEAVMKMDLENLPALMFKNIKNSRINIVYYREDGNISWVDSKL